MLGRAGRYLRASASVLALALWALSFCAHAAAEPPSGTGRVRVAQADALRASDHTRFVSMLADLHRDETSLGASDRRYLHLLDGWETSYNGRYAEAEIILRGVMAQADDDAVGTRAAAALMFSLGGQGKYAEAYAIATRAADGLPEVTDREARFVLLGNLSQMLTFAGEPQLGLKYADMMLKETPAGQSPCVAMVQRVTALEGARQLTSRSLELKQTIDICAADRQPVFANTISLILIDRLIAEHKLDQALAAVEHVTPGVVSSDYFSHLIDLASQRAQIYKAMGKDVEAEKAALEAVAMSHPGDMLEALRSAYRVLYSIEKSRGHHASALDYYERYVIQDQGYLRDANVRNAAYEAARQHFLAEKFETEGLSKQNRILRLQQALDANAVETSRLYVVVLVLVLVSIIFWMVRIKRSQLRFKWLSSCDGLTGIYHHQHFMSEAERALRTLEKRSGEACLLFLDLDHFKQVNDTYGHAVGDAVLKHVVAICKGQLRQADLLGRLGGEEFGMLLMDTPRLQGSVVVERLRLALAATPSVIDDQTISCTASMGLACTDNWGYDLQRLSRAADAALYAAKHMGRNRAVLDEGGADSAMPAHPPGTSASPRAV